VFIFIFHIIARIIFVYLIISLILAIYDVFKTFYIVKNNIRDENNEFQNVFNTINYIFFPSITIFSGIFWLIDKIFSH